MEPAVGVKAAVALMRGVTQVWIEASALSAVRKDEHEAVMLDGMRVESDYRSGEFKIRRVQGGMGQRQSWSSRVAGRGRDATSSLA